MSASSLTHSAPAPLSSEPCVASSQGDQAEQLEQLEQLPDPAFDGVVARINGVLRRRGLQTARELGQIVIDAFFGGDFRNFRAASGKNIDFQRLCDREDLHVSYHQLWTAVSVAAQLDELPADVAEALSVSHHRALLAVSDPDSKYRLATSAAQEGWTRRELVAAVAAWRAEQPRTGAGRPPLPGFVRAVRMAVRTSQQVRGAEPAPDDVRAWGLKRTEEVLRELEAEMAELKAWQGRLLAVAAEVRAAGPGAGNRVRGQTSEGEPEPEQL